MKSRTLDWLAAGVVFVIALIVYLWTVSPTVAFWDVGEFIACSYNLGVPHPPGTPLYVLIGKIFTFLPISAEIAFRVNFISVLSAALSAGVIVLLTSRIIRGLKNFELGKKENWLPTVVGVVGALFTMVAFSVWENALEAEVYAPSALIGLLLIYLAIMWREQTEGVTRKLKTGKKTFTDRLGDNRLIMLAFYVIFLSAGIHLTPVMMLFALIPFVAMVNHKLLPTFFLGVLGLSFMLFQPGWPQVMVLSLFVVYFLVEGITDYMSTGKGLAPALIFTGAFLVLAILAMLKVPPIGIIIGGLILTAAFFYAGFKYKVDMKFFALGALVILIAASVQFYLMVRAQQYPSINMVSPSTWDRFLSVLRREQYGRPTVENQLWPRKTVINIETGQPTGVGILGGLFWQVALYGYYFLWQWGNNLLLVVPFILGLVGLYSLYKKDKKLFWLLFTAYLISSFGLVIYLNMRFGHSGPLPRNLSGLPQEVRERDYFFMFSYLFWGVFTGFGFFEILTWFRKMFKRPAGFKFASAVGTLAMLAVIVPIFFINLKKVNRHGDWIPLEYGYNLLASCDNPGVILTNGDNDTFPLWFVQEVPSTKYENNEKPYKNEVINANLSLLNTPWYIEHIKRKGAPISFVYESLDEEIVMSRMMDRDSRGNPVQVWKGTVAHPPVRPGTFEMSLNGQEVSNDRKGRLKLGRKRIGKVDLATGIVTLKVDPGDIVDGKGKIVASYGSGEIESLPIGVPITRDKIVYLADIIIRDMLATNSGKVYSDTQMVFLPNSTVKIPIDYLLPIDMFIDSVMVDYQENLMPIYFSATVSPSRVQEYAPHLRQEGLVYRFRKADSLDFERIRPEIAVEKSINMFENEYKMESILDPNVRRDKQSRGLFINYGIIMQEIAEQLVQRGEAKRAYEFVKVIDEFEVEDDVRAIFLFNLDGFAIQAHEFEDAERYFTELEEKYPDRIGGDMYMRRGTFFYRLGDVNRANAMFDKAYKVATNKEDPDSRVFASLVIFQLEGPQDTTRAIEMVEDWNRKFPGSEITLGLYLEYLKMPREALKVLDIIIRQNPRDLQWVMLRDSLIEQYNLGGR